jgi:hypothetical protein
MHHDKDNVPGAFEANGEQGEAPQADRNDRLAEHLKEVRENVL